MKKQTGFTLIELMVTLAMVGILLAVGAPSIKNFVKGDRLTATSNDLLSALHVARSEAIKNNASVTVCESADGANCTATGEWRNGWIVFIDSNRDQLGTGAPCVAINTDCLLRIKSSVGDEQMAITGVFSGNATIITALAFSPRGFPMDTSGTVQAGEFGLCVYGDGNSVLSARAVNFGMPGRARVRQPSDISTIDCPAAP